jgi:hypothetical protein
MKHNFPTRVKLWFAESIEEADFLINLGFISWENMKQYFLRRFPWEEEDKDDKTSI